MNFGDIERLNRSLTEAAKRMKGLARAGRYIFRQPGTREKSNE